MVDAHLRRIFLLSFTLGLTTLAFIIAKTGRDALFFQGSGGLLQLPLIYIYIAGASLPLAMIFVKAMKTWGARPARVGILSTAAAVMAAAAPFLQPGDNTLLLIMFMFIPAIFGLVFASLWLLASDIFEKTEKKEAARAFSKIGAGTLAGGMLGGMISKALAFSRGRQMADLSKRDHHWGCDCHRRIHPWLVSQSNSFSESRREKETSISDADKQQLCTRPFGYFDDRRSCRLAH